MRATAITASPMLTAANSTSSWVWCQISPPLRNSNALKKSRFHRLSQYCTRTCSTVTVINSAISPQASPAVEPCQKPRALFQKRRSAWCRPSGSRTASSMAGANLTRSGVAAEGLAEQAIELPLGDAVALARTLPQAAAVEDGDDATTIADQACSLQGSRRRRDAGALHTQHHRKELLGQQELVGLHPVMGHQHPAAAALLQGVEVVAGGGLRDLIEQRMGVSQHDGAHRGAARQLGAEPCGRHAQARAGHLDIDAGGRPVAAQQQRQADHALVADRADLGPLAAGHGVDQRADASLDEVDIAEPLARAIQRLPVA